MKTFECDRCHKSSCYETFIKSISIRVGKMGAASSQWWGKEDVDLCSACHSVLDDAVGNAEARFYSLILNQKDPVRHPEDLP